jgi:hypothetical protein
MSTTGRVLEKAYHPGDSKPDSYVVVQVVFRLLTVVIVGVLTATLIISANP